MKRVPKSLENRSVKFVKNTWSEDNLILTNVFRDNLYEEFSFSCEEISALVLCNIKRNQQRNLEKAAFQCGQTIHVFLIFAAVLCDFHKSAFVNVLTVRQEHMYQYKLTDGASRWNSFRIAGTRFNRVPMSEASRAHVWPSSRIYRTISLLSR